MSKDNEEVQDEVQNNQDPEDKDAVSLSQEKLNSLIADARRKGQDQGQAAFLKGLGLGDTATLEDVKSLIEEAVGAREASKTSLEKAEAKISQLEAKVAETTAAAEQAKLAAENTLKQAAVLKASGSLKDYQVLQEAQSDIWTFIEGTPDLLAKIEIKDNKVTGAEAAVLALLEAKPYLAKKISKQGPGTDPGVHKSPASEKHDTPAKEPPLVRF